MVCLSLISIGGKRKTKITKSHLIVARTRVFFSLSLSHSLFPWFLSVLCAVWLFATGNGVSSLFSLSFIGRHLLLSLSLRVFHFHVRSNRLDMVSSCIQATMKRQMRTQFSVDSQRADDRNETEWKSLGKKKAKRQQQTNMELSTPDSWNENCFEWWSIEDSMHTYTLDSRTPADTTSLHSSCPIFENVSFSLLLLLLLCLFSSLFFQLFYLRFRESLL